MRTGKYRFATTYTQRRWFQPPTPVQALMVEVEEPIDVQGNRSVFWRPATPSDVADYEARQQSRVTVFEETVHERLDDMGKILHQLSSAATAL